MILSWLGQYKNNNCKANWHQSRNIWIGILQLFVSNKSSHEMFIPKHLLFFPWTRCMYFPWRYNKIWSGQRVYGNYLYRKHKDNQKKNLLKNKKLKLFNIFIISGKFLCEYFIEKKFIIVTLQKLSWFLYVFDILPYRYSERKICNNMDNFGYHEPWED